MTARLTRAERGCEVDGCGRPHYAKGMCETHRQRQVRAERGAAPRPSTRRLPSDPSIAEFTPARLGRGREPSPAERAAACRRVCSLVLRVVDRDAAADGGPAVTEAQKSAAAGLLAVLGLDGEPAPVRHLERPDVSLRRRVGRR